MKVANLASTRTRIVSHFARPFALTLFSGVIGLIVVSRTGYEKSVVAPPVQQSVHQDVALLSNDAVSETDNDQAAVRSPSQRSSKTETSSNEDLLVATSTTEAGTITESVARATKGPRFTATERSFNAIVSSSATLGASSVAADNDFRSASHSSITPADTSTQDLSSQNESPKISRRVGFTPEQELYRALYGWGAFESGQASVASQGY